MGNRRYEYFPQGRIILHIFCASGSNRLVQYPMLRSMAVSNVNPSSLWSTSLILGIGIGVLTILLFASRKSVRKRTDLSFFAIINAGEPNSEQGCSFSTPSPTKRSTSFLNTAVCACRTRKARPWYGFAPGIRSNHTGSVWKSPKVPSKNYSYFCNNFSKFACCMELKWAQFF